MGLCRKCPHRVFTKIFYLLLEINIHNINVCDYAPIPRFSDLCP